MSSRSENANPMRTAAINVRASNKTFAERSNEITDELQEKSEKAEKQISTAGTLNEREGINDSTFQTLKSKRADLEETQDRKEISNYRVCLYYAQDNDLEIVEKLTNFLQRKGYMTLRVQKRIHQNRDIRYFFDEDKDVALFLQSHVHNFLTNVTHTKNMRLQIKNLRAPFPDTHRGLLEIWIDSLNLNSSGLNHEQS